MLHPVITKTGFWSLFSLGSNLLPEMKNQPTAKSLITSFPLTGRTVVIAAKLSETDRHTHTPQRCTPQTHTVTETETDNTEIAMYLRGRGRHTPQKQTHTVKESEIENTVTDTYLRGRGRVDKRHKHRHILSQRQTTQR